MLPDPVAREARIARTSYRNRWMKIGIHDHVTLSTFELLLTNINGSRPVISNSFLTVSHSSFFNYGVHSVFGHKWK